MSGSVASSVSQVSEKSLTTRQDAKLMVSASGLQPVPLAETPLTGAVTQRGQISRGVRSVRRGMRTVSNPAGGPTATPHPPLLLDVERHLAAANDWHFDVFKVPLVFESVWLAPCASFEFV